MVLVGPFIVLLGVGLAAIQLVPLYRLSEVAARGQGLSYASASDFAMAGHDLVTALLPFFFRGPDGQWWSLWFQWETTLYVGIAPLALAAFAIAFTRRAEVGFFVAIAVVGLLLALGDNSPLKLFSVVWHSPGLGFLRAPGRFALFVVLAGALLSGFGLDHLARLGDGPRRRLAHVAALCLVPAVVGLLIGMTGFRLWLTSDPAQALAMVQDHYVSLPHDPGSPVDPAVALRGLQESLDILSPDTLWAGLLWIGTALLLVWSLGGRQVPRHAPLLLVAIAAVDLLVFAMSFHHVAPVDVLTRPSPLAQYLRTQPGDFRVLSSGSAPAGMEPDRLLSLQISDASGYSSLAPQRVAEYLKRANSNDGKLLDLLGVRYLLSSQVPGTPTTAGGVRYDRGHPIRLGASEPDGTSASFGAGSELRATEIRWVGYLINARHLPQGTQVGTLRVVHSGGIVELPLRAGIEIADNGLELPLTAPARHAPTSIAYTEPLRTADGTESHTLGYLATAQLPERLAISDISIAYTHPDGALYVLGIGTLDANGTVRQLARSQPGSTPGGEVVFADPSGSIVERASPMERAFLVSQARWLPGEAILDTLAGSDFDPRREVLLEGAPFDLAADAEPLPGSVETLHRSDRQVELATTSTGPAILVLTDRNAPGWRATIDGTDTPIATADYLFRAVPVPAGEHRVVFRYEPQELAVGAAISLVSLLFAASVLIATVGLPRVRRHGL
jgi:hypothetical protein